MAKTKDEVKTIDQVRHAKARRDLPGLCAEYRDLADQKAAIEAAQRSLMEDIKPLAKSARISKVRGDGWLLSKIQRTTSKIEPELLVEKGVAFDVIDYATVEKTSEFYQVRPSR